MLDMRDTGMVECRTGGMQDWRDVRQDGCKTGGRKEVCRKGEIQDMRDTNLVLSGHYCN